jgi:hypothetical protein
VTRIHPLTYAPTLAEFAEMVGHAHAKHYENTGEAADTLYVSGDWAAYYRGLTDRLKIGGIGPKKLGPLRVVRRKALPSGTVLIGAADSTSTTDVF